jgi:hypothetical protein
MPRGVMAVAETQEEAEKQVISGTPQLLVLRSREIDLSGLPPLRSGPLPKHWVVVVEHRDPGEEAKLVQHDDPEAHCERETREMYTKMATDPESLVTGDHWEFDCPACNQRIQLDLPPPRAQPDPVRASCPECQTDLVRAKGQDRWEISH